MEVRTRFAPSPTGYMHLGNLRTALYTYLYARSKGGKFILRIEDTDQEREVPGAVDVIYNSMRIAGLSHDEGPDVGGPCGPYVQSQRKDTYMPYAKQLIESGHAYYCFCTKERLEEARKAAEARGENFKYDKHCLHLSKEEIQARLDAGEEYVIRQNIPTEGKAGFDDVIYGHVEYLSSAPKYNLLYAALGWTPPTYVHLTPVMVEGTYKNKKTGEYQMAVDENGMPVLDENGNPVKAIVKRKMSKSQGDPSFEDLLAQGYLVEAVINYLVLLGWSPKGEREFFTLKELEEAFDLEGLSKSPSVFDMQKLNWFNAEYIRKLSPEKYLELATPWLEKVLDPSKFDFKRLAELLQGRTEVFNQLPGMIRFLAELPEFTNDLYVNKKQKSTLESAKTALNAALPLLEGIDNWTEQELHDRVMEAIPTLGMKNGQFLWPLRIAISGQMSTPGGAFEIAYLLGKDETLRRLKRALGKF